MALLLRVTTVASRGPEFQQQNICDAGFVLFSKGNREIVYSKPKLYDHDLGTQIQVTVNVTFHCVGGSFIVPEQKEVPATPVSLWKQQIEGTTASWGNLVCGFQMLW